MEYSSTDRRAHQRYNVAQNRVILYNGNTYAEIINISEGGVLCRFLSPALDPKTTISTIDLINAKGKLVIQKISCNDLNWYTNSCERIFGNITLRECRLKFIDLDGSKKTTLKKLLQTISNCTPPENSVTNFAASEDG